MPKTEISFAPACRFICCLLRQKGIGFFLYAILSNSSALARDGKNCMKTGLSTIPQYFQELLLEQYISSICLIHQTEPQRYCLARIISEQLSRLENMHWSVFRILKNDTAIPAKTLQNKVQYTTILENNDSISTRTKSIIYQH